MSNEPRLRTLRLPPANFNELKIPRTRLATRTWFRVHQARFAALHFSLSRSHRFSHRDCPYPFLYLAADIATCLFERFGDKAYDQEKSIAQSLWEAHILTSVQIPVLQVCDLTTARTLSAVLLDLSAIMHNDVATPQEWGLAIQRHPANFDGIKFRSRFNGKACLALFKREKIEKRLREQSLGKLAEIDAAVDWLDQHKVNLY